MYNFEFKGSRTLPAEIGAAELRGFEGLKAFKLAVTHQRRSRVPRFAALPEDNARRGFFEHDDFDMFVGFLPEPIDDVARFAYPSGWRRGEVVPLKGEAVDRSAREVRRSASKNGEGRVLQLYDELWSLIERRRAAPGGTAEDGRGEGRTDVSGVRPAMDTDKTRTKPAGERKKPVSLTGFSRRVGCGDAQPLWVDGLVGGGMTAAQVTNSQASAPGTAKGCTGKFEGRAA